jgi:hypothetical protein
LLLEGLTMNRRGFLSTIGLGVLAAALPGGGSEAAPLTLTGGLRGNGAIDANKIIPTITDDDLVRIPASDRITPETWVEYRPRWDVDGNQCLEIYLDGELVQTLEFRR